jgi:hypothetical protein
MSVPPPPAPSGKNGYLDFLALGAAESENTFEYALARLRAMNNQQAGKPFESRLSDFPLFKVDERIPQCRPVEASCLDAAAAHPQLQKLIDRHQVFLRRYRAMRDKPEFVDLFVPTSPDDALPAFQELFEGSRLSLLMAAVRFNAGDRTGAIEELEREYSFHRKVATGSRSLLQKMIAYALLERNAFFVAEITRQNPGGLLPRLEALLREPTKEELDLIPVLRHEFALTIGWMGTRRHVRQSDAYYELAKIMPEIGTRPWWDPVAPYLYRPRQSVNLYAVKAQIVLGVAALPGTGFFEGTEAARKKLTALEPGQLARVVLNPVGHRDSRLGVEGYDYIARMHSTAGVQTLVRLLVRLRAAGLAKPDEVASALEGPLGRSHPDPFTGKPMHFDPRTGTIGFDVELKHISGVSRPLVQRYGRMALPL